MTDTEYEFKKEVERLNDDYYYDLKQQEEEDNRQSADTSPANLFSLLMYLAFLLIMILNH